MVRRFSFVLLVLAFSAVAVPAQAETIRFRTQGGFAIAVWDDPQTATFAVAEVFQDVDYLILILETANRDAQGTITGYTGLYADANLLPYGTFTIDRSGLTSASLVVADVPAGRCEYDANFEVIGECTTDAQMDANVTWTGSGQLRRSNFSVHDVFHDDGMVFVTNISSTGTDRDAGAAGSINQTALSADDLVRGSLAFSRRVQVHISVCPDC